MWASGVLLALAAAVGIYNSAQNARRETQRILAENGAAWNAIHKEQLEFRNVGLAREPRFYDMPGVQNYEFKATVKNNSADTLGVVQIKVWLKDCEDDGVACETIGSQDTWIGTRIPPGEVREIRDTLHFANQPEVRKKFTWSYEVGSLKRF